MLQSFRDQIKGWVATVVIGLLIIPFALWGVNSYFQYGAGGEWVAQIDGEQITVSEFRGEFQQQLARYQQMLGAQYRPEMFDTPAAREQVLKGMVTRALVERRAKQAGYRVGDAELADEIRNMDFFKVDGKFDGNVMSQRLAQIRMTKTAFDARMRKDMTDSQLPDAVRGSEFVLPDEVARGVALLEEQRSATWLAIPAVKFLAQVQVTDAEIEQHYQADKARFMTEESVTLEYLALSPDTLPPDTALPTDAELDELYDQDKARFQQPERRSARHILVDDEATAKAVMGRLEKGEDFATLAAQFSKDGSASNGGELGAIKRGDTVGPFEDALFAMKAGELRGPVKSEFGFHVIRLDQIQPALAQPLAAVKDELVAEWQQRHAAERFGTVSEQLAELVYSNSDSLRTAADTIGLKIERVEGVTRFGGAGIATEQKVRDAAFSPEVLVEARNSGVIEVGESEIVVVRVAAHQPATLRPLAEVREQVVAALRETKASALAQTEAEAVATELRAGVAPADVARREQLPPPRVRTLKRNGRDAPPEVAKALFGAGRPAAAPVVGVTQLDNGDRMVFRVDEVIPGDYKTLSNAERASRRDTLTQRFAALAFGAYTESLKRDADVKLQPEKTR